MVRAKPDYILAPFTVVIDQQEKHPWPFKQYTCDAPHKGVPWLVPTVTEHLKTGDYSLRGFEDRIAIERKNPEDAVSTVCYERDRFERELQRLSEMEFAAVVVETNWDSILYRSCPVCGGSGAVIPDGVGVNLSLSAADLRSLRGAGFDASALVVAELSRLLALTPCAFCEGSGQISAIKSAFAPKSFFRSVNAWEVEYPNIRWEFCATRNWAERRTLRWLQRFHETKCQPQKSATATPTATA